LRAWNHADATALQGVLAADAELAMSAKRQGARLSKRGGYTVLDGWEEIARFAARQWRLGERFAFSRIEVFDGSGGKGAYAREMRAMYSDGSRQLMSDAKFVYSCKEHDLYHIVLVAWTPAR